MSHTARVTPGERSDVGALNWAFAQVSGLVTGTTPSNLVLTLGRNRRLFRAWLPFAGRLMVGGRLPRRDTELIILRVAHITGCDYEQAHHRHLAKRAGATPTEIDGVIEGPSTAAWSDREHALLAAVDELHDRGDLVDDTWVELRRPLMSRRSSSSCCWSATTRRWPRRSTRCASPSTDPVGRRGSCVSAMRSAWSG